MKPKSKTLYLVAGLILLVLLMTACAPKSTPTPTAENTITDIEWRWTRLINQTTKETTTIPDPEKYTITFKTDGSFEGKADCNNFSGTYTQENGFFIELGPSTMAYCGEESLDQQYLALLGNIVAGGPDGAGGFALETAGGEQRMEFEK